MQMFCKTLEFMNERLNLQILAKIKSSNNSEFTEYHKSAVNHRGL